MQFLKFAAAVAFLFSISNIQAAHAAELEAAVPVSPGVVPGTAAPTQVKWAFPAPLKNKPPTEIWLPHTLSDAEKKHRIDADRMLMANDRIDSNELQVAGTLQDELRTGQYDDLESQLNALLEKFLADPAYEFAHEAAARFAEQGHVRGDVLDTDLLEAWVKARPNSPWAHYSRGLRWHQDAWAARGNGWAKDVSQEHWKLVHEDEVKARAEVETALKLQPKLDSAWATLLEIDRLDSDLNKSSADLKRASKAVPTSFIVPDAYEETLEPRWQGSYAMMDDFAHSKLADLGKNPRFWDVQGDAAADRGGCAACEHHAWEVSLKEYNAALAYVDRVSWLEKAGEAALHLHRYALAHAYYERAIAIYHVLPYDAMFSGFAEERCDPSKTETEVEKDRQEVVKFGGLDNVDYPLGPDACAVYEHELPWGDQPLPDTPGVQAYSIESLSDPVYAAEPKTASMPGQVSSLASPDNKWLLTVTQGDDKISHVTLHDQKTGWQMEIYSTTGGVMAGFNSTGRRLFVSDFIKGGRGCLYYDPWKMHPVNVKPKVLQWVADQHLVLAKDSMNTSCGQFINDSLLSASIYGLTTDGVKVFHMFVFDPDSGRLVLTGQP